VDAGGDVALVGHPPDQAGWLLEVEGLPDGDPIATLRLSNAGVATSSVLKRRWSGPFGTAHHIIDPRTGLPVRSDLLTATVIAPRATTAEWAAKAVLISGAERGLVLAQAWGFAAIGLREDGTTVKNHAFLELEVKTRQ
jgi:thiamine biosynthesis lipoprotein